jgi:lipoyl(octanoyl) transferase
MMRRIRVEFEDIGVRDYMETWSLQENYFDQWMEFKRNGERGEAPVQKLLFVEHPHVFTLGKSGDEKNMLIHSDFLRKIDATYYKTNRGGDITYHGPGQIVGYPIINLEYYRMGIREYIAFLEDSIIECLANYDISGTHSPVATGVWLDVDHPRKARKICAIGVRSSRYVTMHGFALNVNTDLNYFTYINPCGFQEKGVTSMQKELGQELDFKEVKQQLKGILIRRLSEMRS